MTTDRFLFWVTIYSSTGRMNLRRSGAACCLAVTLAAIYALQGIGRIVAAMPSQDQIAAASSQMQGQLIVVQERNFDYHSTLQDYLRRQGLFAASDPGLYLVAKNEDDVLIGIKLALDCGMKVAFHGSGHNQAGTSLYPAGLTIDVSNLKDVFIEPVTRTARLQAGLVGLEMANISQAYDLHFRVGHASTVGLSGFTLNGGGGWGGLAVDMVIAMDVVNVWEYPEQELTIKRVNALNWPELFSALQGAGSMLGAVVAFYAELQPLPEDHLIRAPTVVWPLARAAEAWDAWETYNANHTASQMVEKTFVYNTLPGLGPSAVWSLYDWSPDERAGTADYITGLLQTAMEAHAIVLDLKRPYMDVITSVAKTQEYANVVHYSLSAIVPPENMPAVAEIISNGFVTLTSPLSIIIVDYPALGQKSNEDTAYGWRGNAVVYPWAFWTRTAGGAAADSDARHIAWVRGIAAQLQPFSLGHYIGFINLEQPDDTERCFPAANWAKVQAAKAAYDPYNLFRELDFYHSDDGMGPNDAGPDAAVLPISTGGK